MSAYDGPQRCKTGNEEFRKIILDDEKQRADRRDARAAITVMRKEGAT